MQVKVVVALAIILVAQQVQAGTLNFGNIMGDVSKVAVAGEKVIHQLENELITYEEPTTLNVLSDMANALGDLANALTNLRVEQNYVEAEPSNLIGSLLGSVGDALGHLANTITSLSVKIQKHSEIQNRNVASAGASIIGEAGNISAKEIASAAKAAAPYIKAMNAGLGDLANALTHL
ncbi:uncharacterized protein LOC6564225 [Drosophila grimshawi]|uniref:GH19157 n=1 Tax=Drosophila grimshawi TaxID=7222 RepID=B4JEP0_DROGR|nr:uncharacterized protein LOC6564225 [Drosophila grimshawi]EDV93171.1 GH19157 [Drosophila grimshawi]